MEENLRITDFLLGHAESAPVSFHTPGHKGSDLYKRFGYGEFLDKIMDCDLTEIPGADSLFQAESAIKGVQDQYRDLYGVSHSYLLVNGSSGGIIASVLTAVPAGGKLIMARNCHKSVFNALILGDIRPVYAYPELVAEWGISGEISSGEIERCIMENPDASAVILPSPNYYGVCSDISAIAETVHKYGKTLIVDQAHGAHLKFFEKGIPPAAEDSGADIVINSIHKTLASFTQSALLNLNSDRVDRYRLEDKLQCVQSTSPSYLLMASLDINATILKSHGKSLIREWADNLDYFYREASTITSSCESPERPQSILRLLSNLKNLDRSKINIDSQSLGMTGVELEKQLMEHGIFPELNSGNIVLLMTGIGNKREDYEKLISALKEISHRQIVRGNRAVNPGRTFSPQKQGSSSGQLHMPKRERIFEMPKKLKRVPLAEAEGLICASSITPYPPGIPLVCPGERLEADTIAYIKALKDAGEKVIGVNEEGEVAVGAHK